MRLLFSFIAIYLAAVAPVDAQPKEPTTYTKIFSNIQGKLKACLSNLSGPAPTQYLDIIWVQADVTGDGLLSTAEINRMFRIAGAGFAYLDYVDKHETYQAGRQTGPAAAPPENQEFAAAAGFSVLGPLITPLVIANLDYDDNGLLSRGEVLQDTGWENVVAAFASERDRLPARALEAYQLLQQLLGDQTGALGQPKLDLPRRKPPPPQQASRPPVKARPIPGPANGDIELVRRQLHECWILPADLGEAGVMRVTVRVRFNPDGSLNGTPKVTERFGRTSANTKSFRTLEESVISAVLRCTPLIRLPSNPSGWSDAEYVFDLKDIPG